MGYAAIGHGHVLLAAFGIFSSVVLFQGEMRSILFILACALLWSIAIGSETSLHAKPKHCFKICESKVWVQIYFCVHFWTWLRSLVHSSAHLRLNN